MEPHASPRFVVRIFGVLLVYAMSASCSIIRTISTPTTKSSSTRYKIAELPETVDDAYARSLLEQWGEADNFTAVYDFDAESFKVFIRGGSSLLVNRNTGEAIYESIKKRPVISAINRLHYNPSHYWTWFSDIFLLSLVVIVLTGLVMVKGKHGLWGRGGIELLIGIAIPILFMVL